MKSFNHENTREDKDDFWTPQALFDKLDRIFLFDLDVAASPENTKCGKFFTREDNALFQDWAKTNWCNPPYSNIEPFIDKAIIEAEKGNTTVMLIPARTSNPWFQKVFKHASITFITSRLSFQGPNIQKGTCAAEGSMICVFAPLVERENILRVRVMSKSEFGL